MTCKPRAPRGKNQPKDQTPGTNANSCPTCKIPITFKVCEDKEVCYQGGKKIASTKDSGTPSAGPTKGGSRRSKVPARARGKKPAGKQSQGRKKQVARRYRSPKPGLDENGLHPYIQSTDGKGSEFLRKYDETPWERVPHSAKTKATLDTIKGWQEEAPEEKIVGTYAHKHWLVWGRYADHKKPSQSLRFISSQWLSLVGDCFKRALSFSTSGAL